MSRISRLLLVLVAFTVTLLSVVSSRTAADELYSTFGPSDSFSPSGWNVGFGGDHLNTFAAPFEISNPFLFSSVDAAFRYISDPNSSVNFTLALHEDAGSVPGSVLHSMNQVSFGAPAGSILNFDFSSFGLILQPNTPYWLSASTLPGETEVGEFFLWNLNDQGATGLARSTDGGTSWSFDPNEVTPAFRVNGETLLLTNGDFETGSFDGWQTSGIIDVGDPNGYLALPGTTGTIPPQNGNFFASYSSGNNPNGVSISQEFGTLAGQTYTVAFEFGGYGFPGTPQQLLVEIEDVDPNNELASMMFSDLSASQDLSDIFVQETFDFVATGTTSRITLTDSSVITQNTDLFLDNVSVTLISADFDEDGDRDGFDFLAWQRGFGTDVGAGNVAPRANGNANGDQFIDSVDLAIWESQYGSTVPAIGAAAAVPEPSTTALLLMLMGTFLTRRLHAIGQ